MGISKQNLIWIDLEMTGLDVQENVILEIATVITDKNLVVLAEGPVLAIFQSEEALAKMNKWNVDQHTKSGLIERVKESQVSTQQAQKSTLHFLKQTVPKQKSPMCGNSICMDRRFLARYMPELEKYFHYRNLDVSSVKELARRWQPKMAKGFKKESQHMALNDIHDSIEELRYYREHFFKMSEE